MAEPERYRLDTSAFICYFADEPGAARVEEILKSSRAGQVDVFASFMTYMETLYRLWREGSERQGKLTYLRLKALPVTRVDLSVADAWIGAAAMVTKSRLVHKDPEFRPLESRIALIELPLKKKRTRR